MSGALNAILAAISGGALGGLDIATYTQGGDADAETITLDRPPGTVAGDLLVAVMGAESGSRWTQPAGFVEEMDENEPASAVAHRITGLSEPGSYEFKITPGNHHALAALLLRFEGAIFAAIGDHEEHAGDGDLVVPGVTLDEDGLLVVAVISKLDEGQSHSTPSGMTAGPTYAQAPEGPLISLFVESVSAGATGTRTCTIADSDEDKQLAVAFAIVPAPA